ncbi:MAG: phage protein Gp36 family protein [Psychroserpens sp.]|uniref:phage protein Gp36 family protein n=1 Tax=Psychroserpens sp. TaxID=2020870 RepID=UPI003CB9EB62
MAFLTKAELKTKSTTQIIDIITANNEPTVEEIITESIDVMHNCLFQYYNTDAIFAAEGTDRSKIVLKYLKAIVIKEIYDIRSTGISEGMQNNYDEAMNWLDKVSEGKKKADLPPKQTDTDGDGTPDENVPFMKLGSRKNYPNRF